jgi:hypothetical protein
MIAFVPHNQHRVSPLPNAGKTTFERKILGYFGKRLRIIFFPSIFLPWIGAAMPAGMMKCMAKTSRAKNKIVGAHEQDDNRGMDAG